jgi:hypothetical protein
MKQLSQAEGKTRAPALFTHEARHAGLGHAAAHRDARCGRSVGRHVKRTMSQTLSHLSHAWHVLPLLHVTS